MADLADKSQDLIDQENAECIARHVAKPLAPGKPGDCDFCGEWSGRLIDGCCAPCRDRLRFP